MPIADTFAPVRPSSRYGILPCFAASAALAGGTATLAAAPPAIATRRKPRRLSPPLLADSARPLFKRPVIPFTTNDQSIRLLFEQPSSHPIQSATGFLCATCRTRKTKTPDRKPPGASPSS